MSHKSQPIARDDTLSGTEDTALQTTTAALLANDTGPGARGGQLRITDVGNDENGTVSRAGSNITFTPDPDFNGTATFDYMVVGANNRSDIGHVTVNVAPVNDPPTAQQDTASTDEDTQISIDVLANDSDVDGDALSIAGLQGTTSLSGTSEDGAALSVVDGEIVYDPTESSQLQALNDGDSETDTFTYTVSDPGGATATATVNVDVAGLDDGQTERVMDFNAGSDAPLSYLEDGMTVTSIGGGGLDFADHNGDGSVDLAIQNGPSEPYEFTFAGGETFSPETVRAFSDSPSSIGSSRWTSSEGGDISFSVFGTTGGTLNFTQLPGFANVEWLRLEAQGGVTGIDDLMFLA